MKMNTKKSGFTLIELLVVISIITLLSSVLLAALQDARKKGVDGSIKAQMNNIRTQASNYFAEKNSYANLCTDTDVKYGIDKMLDSVAKRLSSTNTMTAVDTTPFSYSAGGAANSAVCHDTASGWAVIVSLRKPASANNGWCIDTSQIAKETSIIGNGSIICGQ
jgi:prepilin-type N-terminal cleavage/methylation domain-containing protein